MEAPKPKPAIIIPLIRPLYFGKWLQHTMSGVPYEKPAPTPYNTP